MKNEFQNKIDELAKLKPNKNLKNEMNKLIEDSNYDHYVVYCVAKYRIDNHLKDYFSLLKELYNDEEYKSFAIYYSALRSNISGKIDEAIDLLERILHFNDEYAYKARNLYAELLFNNKEYDAVLEFLKYVEQNNFECANAYYYASKVFNFNHDRRNTEKYLLKAVDINPNRIDFHKSLRAFYYDVKKYDLSLQEINKLRELGFNDPNKLLLLEAEIYTLLRKNGEAFKLIKDNIQKGVINDKQDSLYFNLCANYCDFYNANEAAQRLIKHRKINPGEYRKLMMMYNDENMCTKALNLFDSVYKDKPIFDGMLYCKASSLTQQNRYGEAKEVLYSLIERDPRPSHYRLLALISHKENDDKKARFYMSKVPCENNKLDIYLRYVLGILDMSKYKEYTDYFDLLKNYNIDKVCELQKYRLTNHKKQSRIKDGVDVNKLVYATNEIITSLTPNYSMDKDVYLLNFEKNIALINGEETSFVIANAIPNGNLVNIIPVNPTKDAISEYQRIK